jgi:hypothetical protein
MMTETKNKRRHLGGTLEQPMGGVRGVVGAADLGGVTRRHEGTKVMEVTVEMQPEGLHADGVRYGPMGLVALEVVGVPVRRVAAIDDELSWLWGRGARLREVSLELLAGRQWGLWELLLRRMALVEVRADELWRRWKEKRGAESICKSLVVVKEGRGA